MGTLPRLFVLAGMLTLALSQEHIFEIIQQDPVWFEVGGQVQVHCKWKQNFGLESNQVVEWKTESGGIKKITKDNSNMTYVYKNTPITEDRNLNVKMDWDGVEDPDDPSLIIQSSILIFDNLKVSDPQEFRCEVEINQEQHAKTSEIIPYAIPALTMHDMEITADLRKPVVEPVDAEYPEGDVNATDAVDMTDLAEAMPTDFDETVPTSRKRRQADFATLDENPVTDSNDTQYISVSCRIEGAYPKPTNVLFLVGESDTMEPTGEVEWSQDAESQLFTGVATLEMTADAMYDKKSVTCTATLPTKPPRTLESSNSSTPFEILHEATKVTTIISPDTAIEGENVMIECRGDGNPAPEFSVESDHPDISYDRDDSGTKFTIASVSRNQEGYYWCIATSPDRSNSGALNTVESEDKPYLAVAFIDTPTLDKYEVQATKGGSVEVVCNAKGSPEPSVEWRMNGDDFSTGSTLSLERVGYSDAGEYECVTSNAAGTETASVSVTVQGRCDIDFEEPTVAGSQTEEGMYFIRLTCRTSGNPECNVNIVAQDGFDVESKAPVKEGGTVTLEYPSVPMLTAPVKFACVASNPHTRQYNRTVTVGENSAACCAAAPQTGGISTGAIVGILLLVLVVVIGIPVACYCVKKRNAPSTKKAPADAEAGTAEKEGLHKEASSEDSDGESIPPPPAEDNDPRLNSSHEMTTFSTNQ